MSQRMIFTSISALFIGLPGLALVALGAVVLAWPGGYGCGEFGQAYAFMSAIAAVACGAPLILFPAYIYWRVYRTGRYISTIGLVFVMTVVFIVVVLTSMGPAECLSFEGLT